MIQAMIVSGPTVEAIDPVRYISNRSSGLTGYYLAQTAQAIGFIPGVFVTGPSCHLPDQAKKTIQVESAIEMRQAVLDHLAQVDVVIMAAAVCDYRPLEYQDRKIKKNQGDELLIRLVKNPDILAELGQLRRPGQLIIGFAAETDNAEQNGLDKLRRKAVDMIILNQISPHNPIFGDCHNQVSFITRQGVEALPPLEKVELAKRIWLKIAALANPKGEKV